MYKRRKESGISSTNIDHSTWNIVTPGPAGLPNNLSVKIR